MSFNRSCGGNCFWYVRLFNEGDPINFYAVLCLTPQELYDTLENDLAVEKEVQNPQRDWFRLNYCVIHLLFICFYGAVWYNIAYSDKRTPERSVTSSLAVQVFLFCSENSVKWIASDLVASSRSCVIPIAFRTAFICFPKAIASAFGIIITSIVLYRSCGKNGITSSFQWFCPIVPMCYIAPASRHGRLAFLRFWSQSAAVHRFSYDTAANFIFGRESHARS